MSIVTPEMAFPDAWSDLRDGPASAEQREDLGVELTRELSLGHVLHGRTFIVVGRSETNDDILIELEDNRTWALVHLTWQRKGPNGRRGQ